MEIYLENEITPEIVKFGNPPMQPINISAPVHICKILFERDRMWINTERPCEINGNWIVLKLKLEAKL